MFSSPPWGASPSHPVLFHVRACSGCSNFLRFELFSFDLALQGQYWGLASAPPPPPFPNQVQPLQIAIFLFNGLSYWKCFDSISSPLSRERKMSPATDKFSWAAILEGSGWGYSLMLNSRLVWKRWLPSNNCNAINSCMTAYVNNHWRCLCLPTIALCHCQVPACVNNHGLNLSTLVSRWHWMLWWCSSA